MCGRPVSHQSPGPRQEPAIRVLGIDSRFDRPAVELHVVLGELQFLARGDVDHLLDQVEAGHLLGHRMLDLQPGVHLEEVEALARRVGAVDDQLDRARRIISDRPRQRDRLLAHRLAHFGRDERRRRFLDHLLVAALDRAFALVQIDDVAVLVAEQLDFDVARVLDEFLDEHAVVAEARQPLALGCSKPSRTSFSPGEAHALAAAAGRGLHHHRIADVLGDLHRFGGGRDVAEKTGDDVDPGLLRQLLGFDLVAHRRDRLGRRADEDDFFLRERLGEALAFRQEAVARMHRLGAARLARVDDQLGLEIGFTRWRRAEPHRFVRHLHMRRTSVGVRINRDRPDPHAPRGADHPARDLPAIGDQDLGEHQFVTTIVLSADVRSTVSFSWHAMSSRPCCVTENRRSSSHTCARDPRSTCAV